MLQSLEQSDFTTWVITVPSLSYSQKGQCFSQDRGLIFKVCMFDLSLIVILQYEAFTFFPRKKLYEFFS